MSYIVSFLVHFFFLVALIHGYRWIGFYLAPVWWRPLRLLLLALFAVVLAMGHRG